MLRNRLTPTLRHPTCPVVIWAHALSISQLILRVFRFMWVFAALLVITATSTASGTTATTFHPDVAGAADVHICLSDVLNVNYSRFGPSETGGTTHGEFKFIIPYRQILKQPPPGGVPGSRISMGWPQILPPPCIAPPHLIRSGRQIVESKDYSTLCSGKTAINTFSQAFIENSGGFPWYKCLRWCEVPAVNSSCTDTSGMLVDALGGSCSGYQRSAEPEPQLKGHP